MAFWTSNWNRDSPMILYFPARNGAQLSAEYVLASTLSKVWIQPQRLWSSYTKAKARVPKTRSNSYSLVMFWSPVTGYQSAQHNKKNIRFRERRLIISADGLAVESDSETERVFLRWECKFFSFSPRWSLLSRVTVCQEYFFSSFLPVYHTGL